VRSTSPVGLRRPKDLVEARTEGRQGRRQTESENARAPQEKLEETVWPGREKEGGRNLNKLFTAHHEQPPGLPH